MPDSLRQDKRIAQLNTPLGKDKLALVGFECAEGVSEKFQIKIEAASDRESPQFRFRYRAELHDLAWICSEVASVISMA